ncbi:uncharacterized protein VDAG_05341 [Verticillium dahliae VdLs.17]|uniref:Rhodopsin domain-containing protein n=1 Tax=Verticillium dahliae (strain VdLs.17 / ATCC MYA-4575 / FGSC 10137) TaxID=498257 RepID=G2X625_VERDV|nr:uncharacterized protein VDAG_05341 [Verticillium dahliae VdLs.17]EGY14177.1 hypothetical protein VDAG_05341 [Verticillium dahliae VdLs.17]KAH6701173.1 hypothetical protein EV126DRAFT_340143 [Verticillium dahliae]
MQIGGDGPLCIAVLWSMAFVVTLFLFLRLYTRIVCVAAYGTDDHFYAISWVLTLGYSIMGTVAAIHGYGRDDLTAPEDVEATYYRMIAQSFSLLATGTSKASVGFFLLRLVVVRWQIISIWAIMSVMGILSILGTIAVDIYFAVLPWIFIFKLNLSRREKLTIAGSLSLGILAAAAGGIRVMNVKGVRDVPVAVIVWSQVETSLTLICVGIPVCRPLWSRVIGKWWQSRHGESYERQNDARDPPSDPIGLHTIGGGTMPGVPSKSQESKKKRWNPLTGSGSRGDDGDSDEVDLTANVAPRGRSGRDTDSQGESQSGHEVKEAWVRGDAMTRSTVEGRSPSPGVALEDAKSGIMMCKTYDVTR